jgi:hypothetical protein
VEEPRKETSWLPLEWGGAKVRLECVFLGKTQHFELDGPFARIGCDPRCEISIPGLPAAVCVYVQVCKNYVAVLELVESTPRSLCDPVIATQGGTVWLQPNARITVQSVRPVESQTETFSWENFNVDDIRVFPNTLVARAGFLNSATNSSHFRIQSALSILGTSEACHLKSKHKQISKFQAILFRGETQGDPCRVVDLFGEHPTLVDNQPAHGQVLEVGSQIQIGTLSFEAARFLYNASRPNHIVEVRSQFKTLPFPNKTATVAPSQVSPSKVDSNQTVALNQPPPTSAGLPDLQAMKDRLVRAIGFDSAASRKPSVHFPTNQSSTPAGPALEEDLNRVVKSQEQLCNRFEELTERLEGMSRSIESLPEIIDRQSQQLVEAIESLRDLVAQPPSNNAPKQAVSTHEIPAKNDEPLKSNPLASKPKNKPGSKPQKPSNGSPSNGSLSNGSLSNGSLSNGASPTKNTGPIYRSGQKLSEKSVDPKPSWVQRATNQLAEWIPYTAQRRRVTAKRDEQSESIDLASQSTSKRTRLRQIDHDSELLASNESKEETQVLGSLVGLRYRDARKTYLRWLLFSGIIAALTLIGGPFVWNQIPDGWRELIWQKVTFSEASQDQQFDTPIGDDTTSSPTEASQPEPMPLSVPETERQTGPGPPEAPLPESLPTEPVTTEPLTTEPASTEPLPTEPLPDRTPRTGSPPSG